MTLLINGEKKELEKPCTLTELLQELRYEGKHFAVALNRQFIPRSQYTTTAIKDQDEIEILMPLQGG